MKQSEGRDWAREMAAEIGRSVRMIRARRGLSAEHLSVRCAELGHAIPRNTIANLENGRKETVPVHELVILAAALGVSPVELVYPVGRADKVEELPGKEQDPLMAAEWFCDERGAEGDTAVGLHRAFLLRVEELLDDRDSLNELGPDQASDRVKWKRRVEEGTKNVRQIIEQCRALNIEPPSVEPYGKEIAAVLRELLY